MPGMDRFRVVGGARLAGEVRVTGAKNSVLKVMAAALLAEGRTTLTNVPQIMDVEIMGELLRRLGCTVDYDPETATVVVQVPANGPFSLPVALPAVIDESGTRSVIVTSPSAPVISPPTLVSAQPLGQDGVDSVLGETVLAALTYVIRMLPLGGGLPQIA